MVTRTQVLDKEIADDIVLVEEEESMECANDLARKEGIFTGTSGGATFAAALRVAQKVILCSFLLSPPPFFLVFIKKWEAVPA